MATLVATKEIRKTHTLIFDNAPRTISATEEHKTPAMNLQGMDRYRREAIQVSKCKNDKGSVSLG